jgi:hypothetical protein
MNGKLKEPKKSELETALAALMFTPHDREVVSLKQYREQRENRWKQGAKRRRNSGKRFGAVSGVRNTFRYAIHISWI